MPLTALIFNTQCYLTLFIVLVAVCGDYLVARSKVQLHRALFDNATHALIGGLCWLQIALNNKNHRTSQTLFEIAACTAIASLIDLDHFLAAKSTRLKDATSLDGRPPLHSSTVPFAVSVVVTIVSCYLQQKWLLKLGLITFVAFATHHTRDATRRGYWFAPFGTTLPVPYLGYVLITVLIPCLVNLLLKYIQIDRAYKYGTVQV